MSETMQPTCRITTDPGNGVNEDLGGTTDHAAWVLDGATGIGEGELTPGVTDAQWYVQRFDQLLRTYIDDHTTDLAAVVQQTLAAVACEFSEVADAPDAVDPLTKPSAAGVITRWTDEILETFVLADCSMLLVTTDNEAMRLTDPRSRLNRVDREIAHGRYRLMTDRGLSVAEARALLRPKVAAERRRLRSSDEHWALCLAPEAAADGQSRRFNCAGIDQLLLCSDGVTRLIDTLNVFGDCQQATDWITDHGGEQTIERLRLVERDDASCTAYPRSKTHDDATIVTVDFEARNECGVNLPNDATDSGAEL